MQEKVYLNILSEQQKDLLPILSQFSTNYFLAGGTAIALHLGHRESIVFDLFTFKNKNQFKTIDVLQKISFGSLIKINEQKDQAHFIVNGVKLTFCNYPYKISTAPLLPKIKVPSLLNLASMKVALGRRAKWKDYVDLYFILRSGITLSEIIGQTKVNFNTENSTLFSEKLFLQQLSYFDDINYDEEVRYLNDIAPKKQQIKNALSKISLDYLDSLL